MWYLGISPLDSIATGAHTFHTAVSKNYMKKELPWSFRGGAFSFPGILCNSHEKQANIRTWPVIFNWRNSRIAADSQIRTSTKPARAQKLWCGLYIHEAVILVPRVEYLQITGIVTYIKRSAYQENEGVRLRGRFVEYFPRLSCITGITAYTSIP
jgi:hypothetical protein